MLIRVGDALVVFLFEFVFVSIRIRIAPAPEFANKLFPLIIGREFLKSLPLFIGNDVSDVLIQPVFVSLLEFRLYIAWLFGRVRSLPGS